MKLTEHFTLEEMTDSETAKLKNIPNEPDEKQIENLKMLCEKVLEPIRQEIKMPIQINSGFRSRKLNKAIGGVEKIVDGKVVISQHCKGEAADTEAIGLTPARFYERIKHMVKSKRIEVDQCILEMDSWVHLSYKKTKNRNQFLIASKKNGKTVYATDLS